MQFSHPTHLLFLLLVLALSLVGRPAARARSRLAFLLRSVLIVLLVFSMSGLRVAGGEGGARVVFVLDHSDSVMPEDRADALQYLRRASATIHERDKASLVVLGGEAVVETREVRRGSVAAVSSNVGSAATNIAAGLRLARSLLGGDGSRRIVLISDGNQTRGDAMSEARVAAADGVPIDVLMLGNLTPANRREVLVTRVDAPATARIDEPFMLTVDVQGAPSSPVVITALRNGARFAEREVRLAGSSPNRFTFADRVDRAGVYRYRFDIASAADTLADNNQGGAVVGIAGKPRILYVGSPRRGNPLGDILRLNGFEFTLLSPSLIPEAPEALGVYDAVIFDEVPAAAVSTRQMRALTSYVEHLGGGFIMTGGLGSFGPGGYVRSPVETILPIDIRARRRGREADLALVLVIDRSGSMAEIADGLPKIEIASAAALSVVDLLDPDEALGIIAFDATPRPIVELTPRVDKQAVVARLRGLTAGGATAIFPAVDLAYRWLERSEARRRHLLLLSDGRSTPEDAARLADRVAGRDVVLSVVGIGAEIDRPLLRGLAERTGGRAYFPERLRELTRIFESEAMLASGAWVVEERFTPRVAGRHAMLEGLDVSRLPEMGGYVASTAKPTADLVIESPRGEPIVATWRAGLGRTAAFTSDLGSSWTSDLRAWDGFAPLWAQLIRSITRPRENHSLRASVTRLDDPAILNVDASEREGGFLNFLDVRATIEDPTLKRHDVRLVQVGPGRYEGRFSAIRPGTYAVHVTASEPDGVRERSLLIGFDVAGILEHATIGANARLLAEIAGATGGKVLSADDRPFTGMAAEATYVDAWPALATLALFLFLIDVAVRAGLRLAHLKTWRRREPSVSAEACGTAP